MKIDGVTPKVVQTDRNLGAQLNFTRASRGRPDVDKRTQDAIDTCGRIQNVPLGTQNKASLVETAALPKVLFDTSVSRLCKTEMSLWRTRCSRAVWGNGNSARCNEIIFTLLTKGDGCDPRQQRVLGILRTARRMFRKHPDLIHTISTSISRRSGEIESKHVTTLSGPAAQIMWACEQLGWRAITGVLFCTHEGDLLDLLNQDEDALLHIIRERLRAVLWEEAGRRRPDMAGLDSPQGVDRAATCALRQSAKGEGARTHSRASGARPFGQKTIQTNACKIRTATTAESFNLGPSSCTLAGRASKVSRDLIGI